MTEREKLTRQIFDLEESVRSKTEEIEKLTKTLQTTPDVLLDRDLEEERKASIIAKNDYLRSQGLIP